MPIFDDTTTHHPIDGTTYGYSGTRIEDLGSSEYTLVSIAADQSGSVASFFLNSQRMSVTNVQLSVPVTSRIVTSVAPAGWGDVGHVYPVVTGGSVSSRQGSSAKFPTPRSS